MSELIDKIKNAKAELLYVSEFVGTPNERASDIERAFQPIFKHLEQPQLNENQKLLLEDLREIKESQKDKNILGLIWVLGQRFTTKSNIKSFTDQEILEVLQALEQGEE